MCSWVRSSVRRWRNSGSRSLNVRVLFVSDVYFPRVNGVSTSIRTFRQDLASLGVDTWLVAPSYAAPDAPSEEPGVLRVPATKVPRDPEDRRMGWRALTRALDALPGGRFDLVHIHTPFIAHYAGVRLARRADIPAIATYHTFFEEYLRSEEHTSELQSQSNLVCRLLLEKKKKKNKKKIYKKNYHNNIKKLFNYTLRT